MTVRVYHFGRPAPVVMSAVVPASGDVVLLVPNLEDYVWDIKRIAFFTPDSVNGTCDVYEGDDQSPPRWRFRTISPSADAWGPTIERELLVPVGGQLIFAFVAMTVGTVAWVNLEYERIRFAWQSSPEAPTDNTIATWGQ